MFKAAQWKSKRYTLWRLISNWFHLIHFENQFFFFFCSSVDISSMHQNNGSRNFWVAFDLSSRPFQAPFFFLFHVTSCVLLLVQPIGLWGHIRSQSPSLPIIVVPMQDITFLELWLDQLLATTVPASSDGSLVSLLN